MDLTQARLLTAAVTVVLAPLATAAPTGAAAAPRVETVATGLEIPWEMAFLPDGRALVTERPGRVRLLDRRGRLRMKPIARVPVAAYGEGGLLGLAVDPRFRRTGTSTSTARRPAVCGSSGGASCTAGSSGAPP